MFERLGHFVVVRRKAILATYLISLVIAGAVGSGVFANLKTQGYDNLNSDSARVDSILTSDFKTQDASALLIIDGPVNVDDPAARAKAEKIIAKVSVEPHVEKVTSYWNSGQSPALRSTDGNAGLVLVYFTDGLSESDVDKTAAHIQETYDKTDGDTTTYVNGMPVLYHAITEQITSDLAKAESIAIPLNIIMLLIIFGTAISSGLPMIVALGSVLGSFLTLFAITQVTDVSIFALNLVTGLGLGLGIDYALLIVNRFREELHAGNSVEESVQKTVASAGRTVFFSGLAVTLVLASLVVFPQYFLKSFAYAGVSVVIFAVLASLFALPAVLAMVGTRIDKYAVRKAVTVTHDDGAWAWLARNVMKRPLIVIAGTLVVLAGISMPALSANFGQVDDRVLPKDNKAAISSAILRDRFDGQQTTPIEVLIPKSSTSAKMVQEVADAISGQQGVVSVLSPTTYVDNRTSMRVPVTQPSQVSSEFFRITAVTEKGPREAASVDIVRSIRNMELPDATLVGGASAVYADSQSGIAEKLPFVFTWLAIATLFVLFLYTGSVLLPIKAVILNLLSLSATLGLVTWVFQEGHLMWLTGDFTVTGTLDTSMIVLIAVVAFGLSMDYEVFMLSRIKEEHDRGASTNDAVSFGLQRSGRIVTAAAVLIALVFACFMTSGVTNIKMLGLGTAFAILLDASVIRGLLVPALMRIAGKWNWWAPQPLAKFHARFGITE